ncbi:hypothetical protein SteCoe_33228 [Stentor coeruleus]|uniref:Uncharacterized protein n=1 Tax=Stentor coeruleus TaxID=5963 RepID=A0A1R2AX75_9CILI|nr:hypothetical protein SteCoe_33228 [Stentor coeruleus]
MLSEDQYFKAKSFFGVYKESLDCLKEISAKKSHESSTEAFYNKVNEAVNNKQFAFDGSGNLNKGANLKSSYFFRLNELFESKVLPKVVESNSYPQVSEGLNSIIDSLKKEIETLKKQA